VQKFRESVAFERERPRGPANGPGSFRVGPQVAQRVAQPLDIRRNETGRGRHGFHRLGGRQRDDGHPQLHRFDQRQA
jgi:hypothetical protein